MLKQIEYLDANGKPQHAAYLTNGSAYKLNGSREAFAQLMAQGRDAMSAYCEAFDESATAELSQEAFLSLKERVKRMASDTRIVLRIQELQQPVIRKLHRKIEYNLQKALEQCEVAWDLAYQQGDTKGLLAAIKMQAELSKLLSQQIDVTHRHGLLDEESTEVLLALRDEVRIRNKRQKSLTRIAVEKNENERATPHEAPFVEAEMVPSGGSTK